MKQRKIKYTILMVCSGLALLPLILLSSILYYESSTSAGSALENARKDQLISIRQAKKAQIEDYFDTLRGQILTFSNDRMIIDAMHELSSAFHQVTETNSGRNIEDAKLRVKNYYETQFGEEYKKQNVGETANVESIYNRLDTQSWLLQDTYIASNQNLLGEKHQLDQGQGDNEYNDRHQKYHPHIRAFLESFGYYDIFLVDSNTGDVVYSVFKELDYTTSLIDGPYANSGLGEAFRHANSLPQGREVLTDFAPYFPSYEGAASFIASPIYDHDVKIGVLIFQMPIGRINSIMTHEGEWEMNGLGQSGETYLIGEDKLARSVSRFLLEDQNGYIEMLRSINVSDEVIHEIAAKGTNIGLQTIDTRATQAALGGETGYLITEDYRGVQVLSAYTPLTILGLHWALMSEIDLDEAFVPKSALIQTILSTTVVLFVIIAVIALVVSLLFSSHLSKPILSLSSVMQAVAKDNNVSLKAKVERHDELGRMADSFNNMLSGVQMMIKDIIEATTDLVTDAEQLSTVSQSSKEGIYNQRVETENLARAMTEMVAAVSEVARSSSIAAGAAEETDNQVKAGKTNIEDTVQALSELDLGLQNLFEVITKLSAKTDQIESVLDVISGVAEQTNLLALNAAIEAARAGDHGRGFAVVADEVRKLAAQTQGSTQEINDIIDDLQNSAQDAVRSMEFNRKQAISTVERAQLAKDSLEKTTDAVNRMKEMNIQIASATEEQNAVVEEINRNVVTISSISETSVTESEQVASSATYLAALGEKLNLAVSRFII